MLFSNIGVTTTAAAAGIATAGILAATPASAGPQVVPFGQSAEIASRGGSEVIDYTVGPLQPSGHNDGIWFSEVTATGVRGSARPVIADFNARAANSSTYWVMKGNQVDGFPNEDITPGARESGRLYFDVRSGAPPDSIVYRDAAGVDEVVWKG